MKKGIELIADERKRQIEKEGWDSKHDDEHKKDEMALAAGCYALPDNSLEYELPGFFGDVTDASGEYKLPVLWPWGSDCYKPSGNRIRDLVKAGALIAAEIDRLQRIKSSIAKDES